MKKVTVFETEDIEKAKEFCDALCGCSDCVAQNSCDYETAEAIDRSEIGINNVLKSGHTMEVDEIMSAWIAKMCDTELAKADEMLRMENLWALGSNSTEQSAIHVENMMRLEKYKTMLSDMKELYCE